MSTGLKAKMQDAAPEDDMALEREFAWAVYDVQRLIARIFDRRMREMGLTQMQGRVLALLRRSDGLTQTEIADTFDMQRAPLGKLVDRLEEAGFVTRRADPRDRRVKRVFMTSKSEAISSEMAALGPELFGFALDGISRARLEDTTRLLMRMKSNLMSHEAARNGAADASGE